jgi:hypothetical protein
MVMAPRRKYRDRGDLGGQAERAILGAGNQRVAGEEQRRYRQERRQQHPRHATATFAHIWAEQGERRKARLTSVTY